MAVKSDNRARTRPTRRSGRRSRPAYPSVETVRAWIENRVGTCERTPERLAVLGQLTELLDRVPTDILIAWVPVFAEYAEPERNERPGRGRAVPFLSPLAAPGAHSSGPERSA